MRSTFARKATVGMALTVSMWMGTVSAQEQFQTLAGVRAETMSAQELATVEGKVADPKFLNFNPTSLDLANLLNPTRAPIFKGSLSGALPFSRLPSPRGGPNLDLKGASLSGNLQLSGL
ncbi:MAG: hypothetical protein ACRERD_02735, partial [Candidatus Binatia bacterium]